ncbi:MAG: universal stress protein [Candidatus Thermoplasmatota archaeon]|nr:universal stress protein [Candidatus Thermoplasmatota archaeon]
MVQAKQQKRGRILLATDKKVEERSLRYAVEFARALDSPMDYWIIVETVEETRSIQPLLKKETTLLQEIAPEVEAEVKRGLAAELMSDIHEGDYDLVILSFRGRRGLKKVFPRAEVLSILHHAKVNVLILWGRRQELKKLLFCTGGSPYGQQAVEFGASVSAALETPVTLLYVAETEPALFLRRVSEKPEPEPETKRALDKALETLKKAGVRVELKVRHGKVADQILSEASSERYDLIVIGSHGMGGIRHFILGSVSEELVKRARIPILVVRAREKRRGWRRIFRRGR